MTDSTFMESFDHRLLAFTEFRRTLFRILLITILSYVICRSTMAIKLNVDSILSKVKLSWHCRLHFVNPDNLIVSSGASNILMIFFFKRILERLDKWHNRWTLICKETLSVVHVCRWCDVLMSIYMEITMRLGDLVRFY